MDGNIHIDPGSNMDYDSVSDHEETLRGQNVINLTSKRYKRNEASDSNVNASVKKKQECNNQLNNISGASTSSYTNSNNMFALLADLDLKINEPNSASARSNNATHTYNNIEKAAKYCPPIIIFNIDVKDMISKLKTKHPDVEFKIVNQSKNKSKIYFKKIEIYQKMMTLLREKNIDSYTFTHKNLKQHSVILRGLHYTTDPAEIKAGLEEKLPGSINAVTKFVTPHSRRTGMDTGLFLVTLNQGISPEQIAHIKIINYQVIKWEKPKSLKKEVQCKRCQSWGHIAKNCNRPFLCVKCDERHNPGNCALQSKENTTPYCVNCKTFGHPANYRGCSFYKSFMEKKRNHLLNRTNNQATAEYNIKTAMSNAKVINGRSFASLFKNRSKNNKPSSVVEDFLRLAREIFQDKPLNLEERIIIFLQNYKSMPVEEMKNQCFDLLQEVKNQYER